MRHVVLYWRRIAVAVALAIVALGGCAQLPRIDPSGERFFLPPASTAPPPQAGGVLPWEPAELLLTPAVKVAPVGSEVVLIAGVRGPDPYLRTNERVEWQIAPGGVGEFVDFDPHEFVDYLLFDFTRPRKITPTYAISSTSRRAVRLTRGTPDPNDDVAIASGQTWVTVTSPVEGTSYVTALAPAIQAWDRRGKTAVIHWIDAQWQFPPPAINPAGTRHVFTTTVTRQSDQSPLAGWRVRYQITGGPPAGFAPTGSPSVEVETDAAGRASAEISQSRPVPGTNTVAIELVRPAGAAGGRIVVASGITSKTWSAPGLAIRVSGPAVASVGATLTYRIEVSNPGDLPVEAVTVLDNLPEGLAYLNSSPPPQTSSGRSVQWQLGRVAPGQCCTIELNVRAERAGSVSNCVEAASGGLRAKDCASTTISTTPPGPPLLPGPGTPQPIGPPVTVPAAAALDLQVVGPERAAVGDRVTFRMVITNRASTTAKGVAIKAQFDPGLEHAVGTTAIHRPLGADLPPGETAQIGVELRVVRPGRSCLGVEVSATGMAPVTRQACLVASGEAPGAAKPAPAGKNLAVQVSTPDVRTGVIDQNGTVKFDVVVTNQGTEPMTNVTLSCRFDPALLPSRATPDHRYDKDTNSLSWTLSTLRPRDSQRLEMECTAVRPAARACNRVYAKSLQGDSVEAEACVEVRAAQPPTPTGLTMNIASLATPAAVGREFSFVVQVANRSQFPEEDVTLTVVLPPELLPVRLGTSGPAGPPRILPHFDGQTIRFDPIPEVSAGETRTYR
ncbi:MAG: DUF11 domain-containing protein, partial [Thermoguttaceae bacterium]|nr:DUF11 domain-containing protein [Thermoguttaceae bacterium]